MFTAKPKTVRFMDRPCTVHEMRYNRRKASRTVRIYEWLDGSGELEVSVGEGTGRSIVAKRLASVAEIREMVITYIDHAFTGDLGLGKTPEKIPAKTLIFPTPVNSLDVDPQGLEILGISQMEYAETIGMTTKIDPSTVRYVVTVVATTGRYKLEYLTKQEADEAIGFLYEPLARLELAVGMEEHQNDAKVLRKGDIVLEWVEKYGVSQTARSSKTSNERIYRYLNQYVNATADVSKKARITKALVNG